MIEELYKCESLHYKCPNCGEFSGSLTHIEIGRTFGPWYCVDCGYAYSGKRISRDSVDLKTYNNCRKFIDTLVLLRINDEPIFIIIKAEHPIEDNSEELNFSSNEYFYNEHTCPANFMGVECIIQGEDADPHGIWQHVETITEPIDYKEKMLTMCDSKSRYEYFKSLFKFLSQDHSLLNVKE